jgi:hypothetical protein
MKKEHFNGFLPDNVTTHFNDIAYIHNWTDMDIEVIIEVWNLSMMQIGKDLTYLAFGISSSFTNSKGETYTASTLDPIWGIYPGDDPQIIKAKEFISSLRNTELGARLDCIPGFTFLPLSYSERVLEKQAIRRVTTYKD